MLTVGVSHQPFIIPKRVYLLLPSPSTSEDFYLTLSYHTEIDFHTLVLEVVLQESPRSSPFLHTVHQEHFEVLSSF